MRTRALVLAGAAVLLLGAAEAPPRSNTPHSASGRARARATTPGAEGAPVAKAPEAQAAQAEASGTEGLRLEELAWLAGRWEGLHDSVLTEEVWLEPRGGLMLGVQRSVSEARPVAFTYLRLEEGEGGVQLVSSAGGSAAQVTRLRVVETAPWRVVFAHTGLTWPQRVQYARTAGGRLAVRLEGVRDGKTTVRLWTSRRVDIAPEAVASER